MDASTALHVIIMGAILGGCGQVFRVFIGWKKRMQEAGGDSTKFRAELDMGRLTLSLFLGATAGILAILTKEGGLQQGTMFETQFLVSVMAAGYAGADFIEGIMVQKKPA